MIYIKHRWMVNRNVTYNTLVISFNEKGIAAIEDRGNNRPLAEGACRFSRGNMEIVDDPDGNKRVETDIPAKEKTPLVSAEEVKDAKIEKIEEKTPEPEKAAPAEAPSDSPAEEKAAEEEEKLAETKVEKKEEEKPAEKKGLPKKKATKKAPGKGKPSKK